MPSKNKMLFSQLDRRVIRIHIAHPKLVPDMLYYKGMIHRYHVAKFYQTWDKEITYPMLNGLYSILKYIKMKTLLSVILVMITMSNLSAQDCNSPNNLLTISGNVAFIHGYMTPSIKIGIWRNVRPSGITAYIGYQDGSAIQSLTKQDKANVDSMRFTNTYFIEAGYKLRLNPQMFLHAYAGMDQMAAYIGADLLYQMGETALIGLNWRKQTAGIIVILRLN